MPRKPRFYLPGVPAHIIQRGNNRQAVFFSDEDYRAYLNWLQEGAKKFDCTLHAYVLMTNHVHLLVTPESQDAISRMIQFVGRHYVTYVNRRQGRSGTLWEGRHKGCVISEDTHLLACSRYIELNPIRADMVRIPGEYRWSSYQANAMGEQSSLIHPHSVYLALGNTPARRQYAYRGLFRQALEPEQVHAIRATVQTGTPLGNNRFQAQIEQALDCKVGQARRGKPGKAKG